nr:MAG TPA: hypothetical protein [Caudoviricetes sp.]
MYSRYTPLATKKGMPVGYALIQKIPARLFTSHYDCIW